jgi:hypothetical protein
MDGRARRLAEAAMSGVTVSPTVNVDLMHDDSSFIGAHKLTPATRYWAKAVASALKGLSVPLNASIVFRRQGTVVRQARLDFLLRVES